MAHRELDHHAVPHKRSGPLRRSLPIALGLARRPSAPPWGHGRASRCEAASKDIIAGVEVLTTIPECGGGAGGTDKRGETKMTVLVGESGAMSIMNALEAAGFVIVSKEALKAGSDGYG